MLRSVFCQIDEGKNVAQPFLKIRIVVADEFADTAAVAAVPCAGDAGVAWRDAAFFENPIVQLFRIH